MRRIIGITDLNIVNGVKRKVANEYHKVGSQFEVGWLLFKYGSANDGALPRFVANKLLAPAGTARALRSANQTIANG
jgi:hypothetical protein